MYCIGELQYMTKSCDWRRSGVFSELLALLLNHVELRCSECDRITMHLSHRLMPLQGHRRGVRGLELSSHHATT